MCPWGLRAWGGCGRADWLWGAQLAFSSWSQVEMRTKIKEVVSYSSSPGHIEAIVPEVIVSLPGLLLEIV